MVDYRRGFAAIHQDPHWKRKIALGVLIGFIPYVGTVWLLGWEMQYQRSIAWGDEGRLPEWSDFKGQALLGLKSLVAVLPYSFAMSAILTPLVLVAPLLGSAVAPADELSQGVAIAASVGLWFLILMAIAVLIMPLTASVMLRVSLFGTLESGFQLKEIRRLMREHRTDLLRAWGFTALNIGLSLVVAGLFIGLTVLLIVLVPGSSGQKFIASFMVGVVSYMLYISLGAAVSLYLGMANLHYFGRYGRAAYNLAEHHNPSAAYPAAEVVRDAPGAPPTQ